MNGKRFCQGDAVGGLARSQGLTHSSGGSPHPLGHRGLVVSGLMLLSSVVLERAGKENKVRAKLRPPHPLSCTLHRSLSSNEGAGGGYGGI